MLYRLGWLHYGVHDARWDKRILSKLEALQDVQIIKLNIKEISLDDLDKIEVDLFLNRVSDAQNPKLIKYVSSVLRHAEQILNKKVLNGSDCFGIGISKALQGHVIRKLNLGYPDTRIIQFISDEKCKSVEAIRSLRKAADEVGYPLLIKPNAGGFGKGIRRIESEQELQIISENEVEEIFDSSNDGILLVQRFHKANEFFRVWHLGGKVQCAVRVFDKENSLEPNYNSCACASSKKFMYFEPDDCIKTEVADIAKFSGASMGSIEYLVDKGRRLYFDINMLSTLPYEVEYDNEDSRQTLYDPHSEAAEYISEQLYNSKKAL